MLTLLLLACAPKVPPTLGPPVDPLADISLAPLPLWTNRYAATPQEQGRFFAISTIMSREGLPRAQAVEVQNRFRDHMRASPDADPEAAWAQALATVKAGQLESDLHLDALAAAPFIVVFDLDETLFDQRYPAALSPTCHSIHYTGGEGEKYIQLNPGWQAAFEGIRSLGGQIAIFSANVDERTMDNLAHWTWEGHTLLDHPDIAGVLTNSYLVLQGKDEGKPAQTVVEPSKDLRIFDETLQRVILVDDNPVRAFQFGNLRSVQKFEADDWCRPDVDPARKAQLGGELTTVLDEVRDSLAWSKAHGVTFIQAFRPYTVLGRIAVDSAAAANGWDRPRAITWIREHPDAVAPAF